MRLEIHKSGGPECPGCGAHPLISVIRVLGEPPLPLDADLDLVFGTARWWRPFKRRWERGVRDQIALAEGRLLELTRWPIAPLPHETDADMVLDRS